MNKIKVEQNVLHLQEEEVELELLKKVELVILGNVYCGIKELNNQELTIVLKENSHLTMEMFLQSENSKNKITIISEEKSTLDFHYACIYKGNNELVIDNQINGNENENNILIRAVEDNGNLNIEATGYINENSKNNTYLEDIKALTSHNNSIKIMPNLLVKTDSVIANHNATISSVEENDLFYLESKGLDKIKASSLIKEGFLKGIISNKNLIK